MPTNKIKLLLICVLLKVAANAQQFNSSAPLDTVKQTGFYQIAVTPALSSLTKLDLSDLRIVDKEQRQIPYVIKAGQSSFSKTLFQPLIIQRYETIDSGQSLLLIANPTKQPIYTLALFIKNTLANRVGFISGSDDNNNWFTIAENVLLEPQTSTEKDSYVQLLHFPISRYKYFKIIIPNGTKDPLNVIGVGKYLSIQSAANNPFLVNPGFQFTQKDSSNRYSYIRIDNTAAYPIQRLMIKVQAPPFFKRQATIKVANNPIYTFELSDSLSVVYLSTVKTNQLVVEINNGDNPPLSVVGITTAQIQKKLIAYLVAGQTYSLQFNDSAAVAPQYDLAYFKDSLPENIPILPFGAITTIIKPNQSSTNWLWPAIIGAIVILGGLTYKLTKEFKQKQ